MSLHHCTDTLLLRHFNLARLSRTRCGPRIRKHDHITVICSAQASPSTAWDKHVSTRHGPRTLLQGSRKGALGRWMCTINCQSGMTPPADVKTTLPPTSTQYGVSFFELSSHGVESRAAAISEIEVRPMDGPSRFVRPQCIHFMQSGRHRRWDMVAAHSSVAILIYHRGLDAILMVRQFRPPAYISACMEKAALSKPQDTPEPSSLNSKEIALLGVPLNVAFTYELCAGIVDKEGKSLAQVAKEEVLEETGYDVPVQSLRVIASALSAVGMAGAKQTLFFTEVVESQRVTQGGGNEDEGEAIDLVGLPIDQIDRFVASHDIPKAPGALFALSWFQLQNARAS